MKNIAHDDTITDDILYGSNAIAKFLGCDQRKVFYYKRKKLLPLGSIDEKSSPQKRRCASTSLRKSCRRNKIKTYRRTAKPNYLDRRSLAPKGTIE